LGFALDLDGPRALQTLSQTDDSISLEWGNSLSDVGGYRVKYTPFSGGSPSEEVFPRGPGKTTKATITGKRIMYVSTKAHMDTRGSYFVLDSFMSFPFLCVCVCVAHGRAKTRHGVWDRSHRR